MCSYCIIIQAHNFTHSTRYSVAIYPVITMCIVIAFEIVMFTHLLCTPLEKPIDFSHNFAVNLFAGNECVRWKNDDEYHGFASIMGMCVSFCTKSLRTPNRHYKWPSMSGDFSTKADYSIRTAFSLPTGPTFDWSVFKICLIKSID